MQSAAKASPQASGAGRFCADMEVLLQAEDADDWVYKVEGAANLILSYTGSSPSMCGKVLRAKKIVNHNAQPAPNSEVFSIFEQLVWGGSPELIMYDKQDCFSQAYAQVMSQHLGASHVDRGVRVHVSKHFLEIVGKNMLSSRPAWLAKTSPIDINTDSALLVSDHSLFSGKPGGSSCISVEIKAKCGFLPSSEYISKENSVKKQVTRYKMHQLLKFCQGQIWKTSDYDPADLFSGSKERICMAIKSIFSTPQNNLRIFVNGSLSFDGVGTDADMVHPDETKERLEKLSKVTGLQPTDFAELLSEAILKSGVLDKLLATQKLDGHDIEGAIHLYYNILGQPCLICKKITDDELLRKYSLLHTQSLENSCKIVRDFLIAATAKDCSLMVCFRPRECETTDSEYDSVFVTSVNRTYDYKAYFVGLDVKPLDKMEHYVKLDQKIVNFYSKYGEARHVPCGSPKGGGTATSGVPLPRKGAMRGKGGKKGKDAAESSGASREEQEREMEKEEETLMKKLQNLPKQGDPHMFNLDKALSIATMRSMLMKQRQFSIGTLPTFKLNVNCSVESFNRFLEDRRFRFQLLWSLYLVNGIVATPPIEHITFQLIELMEYLEDGKTEKSIIQFAVCEFNNYVGGFRPTPPHAIMEDGKTPLEAYVPDGFFTFDNMETPLPSWFGKLLVMKGHSEKYEAVTKVEFRAGLLKVMAQRLLKSFTKENYMRRIPERIPYLEAPMVLFGEGMRSREVLEFAIGSPDGPFGELLAASLDSELRALMPQATTTLVHNWSSLSKVGLWFYVAILELRLDLVGEARVSFRKAPRFMRDNVQKMRQEGRAKVHLVLKDTDGVFSLKRLLGHYVTLVKYDEETVLRSIIRKKLKFLGTYDRCGVANSDENQKLLKPWDLTIPEHFDDHKEWQRWLRIKGSNQDLLTSLML